LVLVAVVFCVGWGAFVVGVGVSDRVGVEHAGILTQAYYALGLFVLGGLDLGVPAGGPAVGRGLLWCAYFLAPALTASAVVEGILRAIRPRRWVLRRLRGHVVVAGGGKLMMEYVARLRQADKRRPVVIVETRGDRPNLDEARDVYGAHIVIGDIRSDVLLGALRLPHAHRLLLFTGDDFVNLDTAAKALQLAPNLSERIVVHVADLHFMRVVEHTRVASEIIVFNSHQVAAEHLVKSKLLTHFEQTDPLDAVVIAGFGRFGQTVLKELQHHAGGHFDRVVLVDLDCRRRALLFDEQVGFHGAFARDVVDGDLRDPGLWQQLEEQCSFSAVEPAFVIGSGDDSINLHTALWLKSKYPNAYVVARSFRQSAFAQEVSKKGGIEVFSVADLMQRSIPDHWVA